jgi:hypothetical protein
VRQAIATSGGVWREEIPLKKEARVEKIEAEAMELGSGIN